MYIRPYTVRKQTSERVKRSIIAGIRAYLKHDQTQWDKHLPDIGEALRSAYHQSIECSPYSALFGQQMLSHSDDYPLLRSLGALDDQPIDWTDKLLVMDKIKQAFENSTKRYNLRSCTKTFRVGDIVYRRNFVQSDATKKYCAKFAPKFVKAKVVAIKGSCLYELEDENSCKRKIYHRNDILETKSNAATL